MSEAHICRHFLEWRSVYFDSFFTKICSEGPIGQLLGIASGGDLKINRQQAITGTNDESVP